MIIGVTKKAQPLFSALPSVEDTEYGKQFAATNPLFCWHANYFNYHRKKILVLLNDLTYTPIILQDINAQKKKQLAKLIPEAIRVAFVIAGVSKEKTEEYLKVAGDIQVGATSNRSLTGSINLMTRELSSFKLDLSETINAEAIALYSKSIHMPLIKKTNMHSAEALRAALDEPLKIKEVVAPEPFVIDKTWDYSKLKGDLSFDEWEEQREVVLANNEKLLAAFEDYLLQAKKLGQKAVNRHLVNLDFYINIFLVNYQQETPLNSERSAVIFLSDFLVRKDLTSSPTSLKQNGSSLRKFYAFLYEAGEISKKAFNQFKEDIKLGVEEGLEEWEDFMNGEDFWF